MSSSLAQASRPVGPAASSASASAPAVASSAAASSGSAAASRSVGATSSLSSASAAAPAASGSASRAASSAAASSSASSSFASSSSPTASSAAASSSLASSSSSSTSSRTSTSTLSAASSSSSSSSALSTGAIIGIVVGVIGGLALVALLWRYCRRRKENSVPKTPLPPPRDPTSMRQRKTTIPEGSINRASSYSTLLGPTAAYHGGSHSRQPSLSDFAQPGLGMKSSMNSLNKVDEHGHDLEAQLQRPSPLGTPSEASASSSSRANSPYPPPPPTDFMPVGVANGGTSGQHTRNSSFASQNSRQPAPAFKERPEWRGSMSSLSSSAGHGYGVTHTGKLVSVQMPKRLGAAPPPPPDRIQSGIARWRDDLQAPSMAHMRTPSNLSMNSPAPSASEDPNSNSNSSEGSHGSEKAIRRGR